MELCNNIALPLRKRAIFPHFIEIGESFSFFDISMPAGAEILHLQDYNSDAMVLALEDPAMFKEDRQFIWVTEGDSRDDNFWKHLQYRGTIEKDPAGETLHLFERVFK